MIPSYLYSSLEKGTHSPRVAQNTNDSFQVDPRSWVDCASTASYHVSETLNALQSSRNFFSIFESICLLPQVGGGGRRKVLAVPQRARSRHRGTPVVAHVLFLVTACSRSRGRGGAATSVSPFIALVTLEAVSKASRGSDAPIACGVDGRTHPAATPCGA